MENTNMTILSHRLRRAVRPAHVPQRDVHLFNGILLHGVCTVQSMFNRKYVGTDVHATNVLRRNLIEWSQTNELNFTKRTLRSQSELLHGHIQEVIAIQSPIVFVAETEGALYILLLHAWFTVPPPYGILWLKKLLYTVPAMRQACVHHPTPLSYTPRLAGLI